MKYIIGIILITPLLICMAIFVPFFWVSDFIMEVTK